MKARDYCISLGLAKPGKGKLSAAAHAAIKKAIDNGQTFTNYKEPNGTNRSSNKSLLDSILLGNDSNTTNGTPGGLHEPEVREEIKSNPKTHDYNTIWGIDKRGRSDLKIAFQYCAKCLLQITYCLHAEPYLPEWIGGGPGLVKEPQ